MNDLLENLNDEQRAAVTHDQGPLLIVAGAGTGKTTVITRRVAHAIAAGRARPDEILALTFTDKAAGEMEERVDRLLPLGYTDLWISTFHSFGERILKDHGLTIGLPADFRLLNEFEQWALVRKNLDRFELDYYRPLGNPVKFIRALVKHFSRAKDENVSPPEYLEYAEELRENADSILGGNKKKITNYKLQITNLTNKEGKIEKKLLAQEISRINEVANAYHVYQQLLLDNNALDFGDLINYTLKLFRERPAILAAYRQQFKYILVDEFQDTNWAQYELVKTLAAPANNLAVVGDDDQSIYAFRGAAMSNILHFKQDYPDAVETVLVKNYRNRQDILDLAHDFIQHNNPNRLEWRIKSAKSKARSAKLKKGEEEKFKTINGRPDGGKENQLSKKLVAQNPGKGEIAVLAGADLFDEMRLIAEKIAEIKIKDKAASWNDFAVLVRANESAKEVSAALEAAGLPYLYFASRGLYAKPVIMDLIAYLKLLDDYHESPAVFRVISAEVFGFTQSELANLNFLAKKKAWSLYSVLQSANGRLGAAMQEKIAAVTGLIDRHAALARRAGASEVIVAFLNDSGYLRALAEKGERTARESISYLNRFLRRARKFEAASDDKSARAFLAELGMEIEAGEQGQLAPDADAGPEAIRVMTAHAAKGLEFKYVFIAGLVDKRFPTAEHKEPIPLPDALVKEILPEGDTHLEEERRLFYVAITRARDGVYFSWAPDYGGARRKKPSRFLVEAGLIDEHPKTEGKTADIFTNYKLQITNYKQSKSARHEDEKYGGNSEVARLPDYFSYTQLTAFNNCPYQYRFAHILKVPCRSKHTFSFGQTMHLALQRIFQRAGEKKKLGQPALFGAPGSGRAAAEKIKPGLSWEEIAQIYDKSWIGDWYENERQKKEYRRLGRESLRGFYEKFKDDWPRIVALEQGVNLKLGGRRIYGKIDRIDETADGLQIVDYKTGQPKSRSKLGPDDKEQLLIYQLAAEQIYGKRIANLQFYYLNDNSELNFIGDDRELKAMAEKIVERIARIEEAAAAGDWPPKPGPLCQFCDFSGICEFRRG